MAQTGALISTLKKALKANGTTYRDVAQALELSEASVKRMFAEKKFSLDRLEQVCQLAGLQISELVRQMELDTRRIDELTEEQEREVVSEPRLLLVAFLVTNGWHYEEILAHYAFTEAELTSRLIRLDKLKLIELLPKNRIKLLISPDFAWRRNGPIQKFFNAYVQTDFLGGDFERRGGAMIFLSGMLSRATNATLIEKLARLATEFNMLKREDQALPLAQKTGCGLILAIRPWEPEVFAQLRR